MTDRAPVVVLGIGTLLRGDDGVGPAAAEAVERRLTTGPAEARVDVLLLDGEPTRLLDAWRDRRLALVLDAVRAGATPGTLHRLVGGRDRVPVGSGPASSHHAGLAEALALGEALDRLPDRLVVLGLEPGDVELGAGLSAPVRAALPTLIDAALDELDDVDEVAV